MAYLRRLILVMTVCASLLIPAVSPVLAQTPAAPAPVASPTTGALPSNSTVAIRPMYFEGVIVILLMAGAIFAVCRSSRRM